MTQAPEGNSAQTRLAADQSDGAKKSEAENR